MNLPSDIDFDSITQIHLNGYAFDDKGLEEATAELSKHFPKARFYFAYAYDSLERGVLYVHPPMQDRKFAPYYAMFEELVSRFRLKGGGRFPDTPCQACDAEAWLSA